MSSLEAKARSSHTDATSMAAYRLFFSLFFTTRSRLLSSGSVSWSWTATLVATSISSTFFVSRICIMMMYLSAILPK